MSTVGGNAHSRKNEKFKGLHPEGRSQFAISKNVKRLKSQIKVLNQHLEIQLAKLKHKDVV